MEDVVKSILTNFFKTFLNKTPVNNILITDKDFKVIISVENIKSENKKLLNFLKEKILHSKEFKDKSFIKNLKQIIFDYMDYQIILSILRTENYVLTTTEQNQDISIILKDLKNLIEKVEEFILSKNNLVKYHQLRLDENIKKLEQYLEIMQPPKFGNIKKLIEYIT